MTYPGWQGVKGTFWLSKTGFQVRQSKGGAGLTGIGLRMSAIDAMGSFAPAGGVTALAVNVSEEATDFPHAIEQEDFELPNAYGGTQQFGVDRANPGVMVRNADPAGHDKSAYTGE